jgi:hypothetical protein
VAVGSVGVMVGVAVYWAFVLIICSN